MPIPQLQRQDADVLLLFLSAPTILFMKEVDDPWFSAHKPGKTVMNVNTNKTTLSYFKDEPASTLGCAIQTQWCDASLPESDPSRCGILRGQRDDKSIENVWADKRSQDRMRWINEILVSSHRILHTIVQSAGTESLVARRSLQGQYQASLPVNQWQIEMENLVSTSLASLQGSFVEAAGGQSRPGLKKILKKPQLNDTGALGVCSSQVG